ncbi:MAG: TlpA disulfide reductase family protein [Chloroflexota bacterium]
MGKRTEIRSRRKNEKIKAGFGVAIGIGIILIGAILMFMPKNSSDNTVSASSYSTIPVEVDFPAPELSLENINSETESLTDYRGQVVLVNNWATWCPPCKAEMPELVAFYNDHAADGFMVVAVEAGQPKEEVLPFVEQLQMSFAVWLDPDGLALRAFKNNNLPNSYVIDREGTVRLMWTGQISRPMLDKYVAPLIDT